ncbi:MULTISPECIES: hypothetical protein [unclassified Clostridium]|uniref:glycan biosynthesis hexose transferase WsfD n=1 Tax=unclassified Clostridium TaxID=2614128 RepID=UPI00029841A1|nr:MULTISPECIES: hypothetical protein [unclassified Clostridium]EKQ50453.1 MAG: hypothetical protein A370_05707 [Clostridium sp. Maddingley MBC34-26]
MKVKKDSASYIRISFIILAILITVGVLFIKPQVGVADQGDFDRVMGPSGLTLLDSDINNPKFIRFYDYIVTDYKIAKIDDTIKILSRCSLSYLIIYINDICKLLGQSIFKTQYLATVYSIIYILAFAIILKSLNIKNNIKLIIVALLILFVFFDGNYLIWFNSLYGEPMMITALLLFIASVLNYIHYKYVIKNNKNIMLRIIFILLTAFLFIGSKLQVVTALPFIIFLLIKIIWNNKHTLNAINLIISFALICIIIIYPIRISENSDNLSKDTQYNSVFYGVLNGSKTPEQDLIDLGLNPDMAVEAKKHAYLDSSEYVKYIPGSEITDEEFYNKINNSKLAIFYLTHPIRLFNGMKYTAGKVFYTSTSLGKCYQSYTQTPVRELHRFTLWSYLRENILPKNLYFIILFYLTVIIFSFYEYFKNKSNLYIKNVLFLLWTVILISVAQFPMPFVGNGKADTAKQLFLFNFIFDWLLLLTFTYIIFKIAALIKLRLKNLKTVLL